MGVTMMAIVLSIFALFQLITFCRSQHTVSQKSSLSCRDVDLVSLQDTVDLLKEQLIQLQSKKQSLEQQLQDIKEDFQSQLDSKTETIESDLNKIKEDIQPLLAEIAPRIEIIKHVGKLPLGFDFVELQDIDTEEDCSKACEDDETCTVTAFRLSTSHCLKYTSPPVFEDNADFNSYERYVIASEKNHIAFAVKSPSNGDSSRTLKFSSIITNLGSHYDNSTGYFTCPVSGLYLFSYNVHANDLNNGEYIWAHLQVDRSVQWSTQVQYMGSRNIDINCGGTVVIQCTKSSQVSVYKEGSGRTIISNYSWFTGFLIHTL